MKINFKLLIICLLLFSQLSLFGNNQNNISDSIKAENLLSNGLNLIRNGLYAESIDTLLLSLNIRTKIYEKEDSRSFGRLYYYLAAAYKNLGLFDQALAYSQQAEQAFINLYGKNTITLAGIYNNMGNIYRGKLNFNEALKYYNQTISIYQNQPTLDTGRVSVAYYNLAEVYFQMDKYEDAIQTVQNYFNIGYEVDKIYNYDLLGAIYEVLGQNEKAIQNYQNAIRLANQFYSDNELDEVGFEYLKLAGFLISIDNIEDAENTINKAKPLIFSNNKVNSNYASLYYHNLGDLSKKKHIQSNDIDLFRIQNNRNLIKAIEYYKNALEVLNFPADIINSETLDSIYSISNIECLKLIKKIGDTYIEISNIYEGEKDIEYNDNLELALHYYQIAGAFVQRLRKETTGDNNKILLASLQQKAFMNVVKTSYLAYKSDGNFDHLQVAFTNAERMKSGSIFDKLEETLAKNNSIIPDSLLQQQKILNYKITTYNQQRYNETNSTSPDTSVIKNIDSILFELNQERNRLNNYLETHYNDYYDLKYSGTLYNIEDIQQKLKNNEVLIEYVLNEIDSVPELYSILISNRSAEFTKQYIDNQFIKDIESSYRFMSDPRYMFTRNEDSKNFCISSHNLYQKLIEPFKTYIQDKKIIIVPDGKLNYLAFDALIDEMPDTTVNIRFNELSYLIKKNCINYSYSANLLFKFSDLSKKANKGVLAFAPVYNNETINVNNQNLTLLPLPGVQEEVENISNEIKTKIFQGANATESNFLQNSEKWDILHLAMHAYINDSLPAFSSLVFTQDDNSQSDIYGRLSTADIYNLNLNARLTVLSACNTGSGTLQKGEGIMSLARGFLYAGCPSIVMTLWEAEDNSATKIMSSFYKFLKKGKSKDEALRMAKLEYLSKANPRLAHPHYWLEYVNIGDSSPLFRSYDFYFFSLLILAFIAITTEQILRIRKARNKRT